MKLLFNENLSPKLPRMLAPEFPGSLHVREAGLRGADDQRIWENSRAQDFAIVSMDTDFRERSFVEGFPPKASWLDVGNAGTAAIGDLLRRHHHRVNTFEKQHEASLLILSLGPGTI